MIKVVKITAIWCNSCLVMNKVYNDLLKEIPLETISLDYDMDETEVLKYNVGKILPVFIFIKDDKEVARLVGEHTINDFKTLMEDL